MLLDVSSSDEKKIVLTENAAEDAGDDKKEEQEVVFIQDLGFTVKIISPGAEPFDIQVGVLILFYNEYFK